jgi:hypothetical protein
MSLTMLIDPSRAWKFELVACVVGASRFQCRWVATRGMFVNSINANVNSKRQALVSFYESQ